MKSGCLVLVLTLLVLPSASADPPAGQPIAASHGGIRNLDVDFARIVGRIRPLHGVNGGPLSENFFVDLSPLFQQLAIPCVRLIAPNFPSVNCVSVHLIFRDFDADPEDPANYDFRLTDDYVAGVVKVGAQPIYNLSNWEMKRSLTQTRNAIPKNYEKWARVCVNIIRHYNEGWADGQRWDIKYWEIWNEPDIKDDWGGTVEQFADFYATVSKAIKAHNSALKVGGPAASSPGPFLDKFLQLCAEGQLPLDFCSWHCYRSTPAAIYQSTLAAKQMLGRHGLTHTESHVNEWSPTPLSWQEMRSEPIKAREFFERNGSAEGGAFDAAVLSYLQDSSVDLAAFYSGDTLRWSFADRNGAPKRSFFAFKAFAQTLDTPLRVAGTGEDKACGLAVLAGLSEDKTRASILISNHRCPTSRYTVTIRNLPWQGKTLYQEYLVDSSHELELVDKKEVDSREMIAIEEIVPAPSVCLIRLSEGPARRDKD